MSERSYERQLLSITQNHVMDYLPEEMLEQASIRVGSEPRLYRFTLSPHANLPESIAGGVVRDVRAATERGALAFGWQHVLDILRGLATPKPVTDKLVVPLLPTQKYSGASSSTNSVRLPAIAKLVEKFGGWIGGNINADLGCGRNPEPFSDFLRARGVTNIPYDPYHQSEIEQRRAIIDMNELDLNTITLSNVLCILKRKQDREDLLGNAYAYLPEAGKLYVTVYEGDKSSRGRRTREDTWQLNRPTQSYVKEVAAVFGKECVVRHGKLIVATKGYW